MLPHVLIFASLWLQYDADEHFYYTYNVTRPTLSGLAAYRSALTLDWLANEDNRQRELAAAFETEAAPPVRVLASDCIGYPKPASGKVARLMLDLLTNLEGDDGHIIEELIHALVRSKLLVETSLLDAEPDLEALLKTPGVMMGQPHTTFPRILAMVWITATDPTASKRHGWCPITKINKYLTVSRSNVIAQQLQALDPVVARARFIMEEFIQHVTPINVYDHKNFGYGTTKMRSTAATRTRASKRKPVTRTPESAARILVEELSTEVISEYDLMSHRDVVRSKNSAGWLDICDFLTPIAFLFQVL